MGYCTIEDLNNFVKKDFLINKARRDEDVAEEYIERIQKSIEDATVEIDGYLSSKYQIPLQVVPGHIKNKCADIAIYYIVSASGIAKDSEEYSFIEKYNKAIKYLETVRDSEKDILNINNTGEQKPIVQSSPFLKNIENKDFNKKFWKGF
ncbi:MAG: hypothetical protein A2086_03330 [Spirochaetes bacterium GWD1_27_9]|nr:MAG: hypothetical protein A2Z98_12560 [Spirochaetes bacterium GWB1_27_13]OHD45281.1 MAG: hypothetical protein A2086_03330 [Spirochaetes bacterium GWD1_27_9]